MSLIKLSICIATRNRCELLSETLFSIINQMTNEVEIIIVDGASTDETSTVVEAFQTKESNIKYFFLEKKGGVDKDFSHSVDMATGKFCWLFSDDDLMNPGAIKSVLNAIEKKIFSLIIVNSKMKNLDMTQTYRERILQFKENRIYEPNAKGQNSLMTDLGSYMSFIGCVVIEREVWLSRDKLSYFGTEFIHIGVIFQAFLLKPALFINVPYISIRLGNAQWSQRSFKIWIINWPKLIWSFSNYSITSRKAIIPEEPLNQYWKLMYLRAIGLYSKTEYLEARKFSNPDLIIRTISRIISISSGPVLNTFFIIYAKIRKRMWMIKELKQSKNYMWAST